MGIPCLPTDPSAHSLPSSATLRGASYCGPRVGCATNLFLRDPRDKLLYFLGCRKWRCNKWGFKGCLSALPSWKSAEIDLFRPFSAFFCPFRRVRRAPGKSRKRRKRGLFPQISSDLLKPPSLKPPSAAAQTFGVCKSRVFLQKLFPKDPAVLKHYDVVIYDRCSNSLFAEISWEFPQETRCFRDPTVVLYYRRSVLLPPQ